MLAFQKHISSCKQFNKKPYVCQLLRQTGSKRSQIAVPMTPLAKLKCKSEVKEAAADDIELLVVVVVDVVMLSSLHSVVASLPSSAPVTQSIVDQDFAVLVDFTLSEETVLDGDVAELESVPVNGNVEMKGDDIFVGLVIVIVDGDVAFVDELVLFKDDVVFGATAVEEDFMVIEKVVADGDVAVIDDTVVNGNAEVKGDDIFVDDDSVNGPIISVVDVVVDEDVLFFNDVVYARDVAGDVVVADELKKQYSLHVQQIVQA